MKTSPRTRLIALGLLMAVVALFSLKAHAAIDSAGVLDNVTARYQGQAARWSGAISAAAARLFWSLALISMVWTFGLMALRKADIGELFAELVRYAIFTGFFFFLLSNASPIASAIMNSLKQLAGDAAGVPGLTPSGIVDVGFKIVSKVIDDSSRWEPVDSGIGVLAALVVLVVLALVAINMVVLLVSGWVLAYAGIFFLGFGGSRWTSDIAINYYKTVLGIAASLMGMTLLVGIGQSVLNEYYGQMGKATLKDLAVILVVACLLLYLVNKIPQLIAGIITGASVGGAAGMGAAGGGTAMAAGAMAGAAAAAAASTMVASMASAAGWGSAVKAAVQQGGESESKNTGVGGMPSLAGAGAGASGSSGATAGTSTPFGAAMGDSGSTGAASFSAPSGGGGGSGASSAGGEGASGQEGGRGAGEGGGETSAATVGEGGGEQAASSGGASGEAAPASGGTPSNGDFASAAEGGAAAPGEQAGRSALGALGAGIAAVAKSKFGSAADAAKHRISQTTGGRVAAEIRSPGSAATDRRNKADINRSQTVAGKAQAARAFMATGLSSGSAPPAFTGDSLAAYNNKEKSIDAAAEISAFANRKST